MFWKIVAWLFKRRERRVGQAKKSRAMGWAVDDCEKLIVVSDGWTKEWTGLAWHGGCMQVGR